MRNKSPVERQADEAYKRLTGNWPKGLVLPFGWCIQLFAPGKKQDTFLIACSETKLFSGIDKTFLGWRIVALRVNHIEHSERLRMVIESEKQRGMYKGS